MSFFDKAFGMLILIMWLVWIVALFVAGVWLFIKLGLQFIN